MKVINIDKENKDEYLYEVFVLISKMEADDYIKIEDFGNNIDYILYMNVDNDGDFRFFLNCYYDEDFIYCKPRYEQVYESDYYNISDNNHRNKIAQELSYVWDKFVAEGI